MKKIATLLLLIFLAFLAGFAANRMLVQAEVKELESQVAKAVGRVWGYDEGKAKEFMGILGTKYTPEELAELMDDMAGLNDLSAKMKKLYFDERLVSTLRGLAYLEILEEAGMIAVKEKIISQVTSFYDEYSFLLEEEPSSEQEKSLISVVQRIEKKLDSFETIKEVEQDGRDQ